MCDTELTGFKCQEKCTINLGRSHCIGFINRWRDLKLYRYLKFYNVGILKLRIVGYNNNISSIFIITLVEWKINILFFPNITFYIEWKQTGMKCRK